MLTGNLGLVLPSGPGSRRVLVNQHCPGHPRQSKDRTVSESRKPITLSASCPGISQGLPNKPETLRVKPRAYSPEGKQMSPTGVHPPGFTRGSVRRTLGWGPKVNEYRLLVLSMETVHCQDHSGLQKLRSFFLVKL